MLDPEMRVYYCFHTKSLQQIAIKIFSLVDLHFSPRYRQIRKRIQLVRPDELVGP